MRPALARRGMCIHIRFSILYLSLGLVVSTAMLVRERRSVNQTGGFGSLVIRIPRAWARSVGIHDAGEVVVAFGFGHLLVVAPPGREAEIDRLVKAAGGSP